MAAACRCEAGRNARALSTSLKLPGEEDVAPKPDRIPDWTESSRASRMQGGAGLPLAWSVQAGMGHPGLSTSGPGAVSHTHSSSLSARLDHLSLSPLH